MLGITQEIGDQRVTKKGESEMKKKKRKQFVTVVVTYEGHRYGGHDAGYDPLIRGKARQLGGREVGAGYCFADGHRDLEYRIEERKAKQFKASCRNLRGVKRIETFVPEGRS